MDLNTFKQQHKDLVDLGVIEVIEGYYFDMIIIDRYKDGDFLCEKNEIQRPRAHARQMGYTKSNLIGTYYKSKQ